MRLSYLQIAALETCPTENLLPVLPAFRIWYGFLSFAAAIFFLVEPSLPRACACFARKKSDRRGARLFRISSNSLLNFQFEEVREYFFSNEKNETQQKKHRARFFTIAPPRTRPLGRSGFTVFLSMKQSVLFCPSPPFSARAAVFRYVCLLCISCGCITR